MEQHQQHQPRLCQEAEFMKVVRPGPADSPPPNCAICLGICTNKCFTDCCLHQFCFSCLLEWSKIKAECPLCKQPFKSIIYNIKSNLDYEEYIITNPEREVQSEDLLLDLDEDIDVRTEYLFLPNGPRPQRHFQYRTTFTLEPGGEFAIQQLLLSHPRTNSIYLHSDRYLHRLNHHSIHQRRNVYSEGLWVEPQPDITGRYRECTPSFFRENPAQIHRIAPWLNRELSAMLVDFVDIYQVQERIMEMLCQYSIQSASFRSRLVSYLGNKTDHFIHEFYNFVRSPYDMVGYDRHATYTQRPPVVYSHSVSDDDSDVRVVDSPPNDDCIYVPPRTPEVIVINSDSSSDSDVFIRSPSPPSPVVNLVDSDTDATDDNVAVSSRQPVLENNERPETSRSPQLPIKIRYKRNRNSAEVVNNKKHKDKKNGKMKWYDTSDSDSTSYQPKSDSEYSTAHISTSSSSSSSSSESSSSSASNKKFVQSLILKRVKPKSKKRKSSYKSYKAIKYRKKSLSRDASPERSYKIKKRKSSKQKKSKRRNSEPDHHRSKKVKRIKMEQTNSTDSRDSSSDDDDGYCGRRKTVHDIKTEVNNYSCNQPETKPEPFPEPVENESSKMNNQLECDQSQNLDVAGPSQGPSLRSVIVRGNSKWYSRPELEDTTTDNNSD